MTLLRSRAGGAWVCNERYCLDPSLWPSEYVESFGNLCQHFMAPPGRLRLRGDATVETDDFIALDMYAPGGRVGGYRDFAQAASRCAAACRSRRAMVVGYLYHLEPMGLHALFEAFVGGRRYTFDATQSRPRGGRIVLAYGRDVADVAIASTCGPLKTVELKVWFHLENHRR